MQVVWNVWSRVKSLVSCDTLLFEFVVKCEVESEILILNCIELVA